MPKRINEKDESFNRLCECLRMIREDVKNGKFTKIADYTSTYRVTNFNQRLVIGVVNDKTEKDLEERANYIRYVQNRLAYYYNMQKSGKIAVDIKTVDDAVALLKSKGYKVMKPIIEYEEV